MNLNIRQRLSDAAHWVSVHIGLSSLIAGVLIFGGRFAFQVWSTYDAIPSLPNGALQMVGASHDGARFVVIDNRGYSKGANRITILVAFVKPAQFDEGTVRFEAKRELVDCSKRQIVLQGAGFYNDQGRQTISRIFDGKPKPVESLNSETKFVCDNAALAVPRVVGYRAALSQAQTVIAQALAGH